MNNKVLDIIKKIGFILFYPLLVAFYMIASLILSIITIMYFDNKSKKNFVKKVEYKKAKIFDSKLKAVEELNKLESKLSKMSNEKKIAKTQRKIETLNKHIENYNIALNTELPQPKVDEKLLEKVETKINDIKENVL